MFYYTYTYTLYKKLLLLINIKNDHTLLPTPH